MFIYISISFLYFVYFVYIYCIYPYIHSNVVDHSNQLSHSNRANRSGSAPKAIGAPKAIECAAERSAGEAPPSWNASDESHDSIVPNISDTSKKNKLYI